MKQGHDQLFRFIRRTFGAATIAIVAFIALVFFALFVERARDDGRARHSREVSRTARDIQILALERERDVRGALLFGDPHVAEGQAAARQRIDSRLDSLRKLTTDDPAQLLRARRISNALAEWDSAVTMTLAQRASARPSKATAASIGEESFNRLGAVVKEFLDAEETLYETRTQAAHSLDRIIGAAGIVALIIVLVTLIMIRGRLSGQASALAMNAAALDLRNAQLIDQTQHMERQQGELELQTSLLQEAMGELESQKSDLQMRSADLEKIVAALQVSEGRFRSLVDSLHDVVFTIGLDHRYTGMYGGGSRDGGSLADYIGKTACEILGAELGHVHQKANERALLGEPVSYDWSMAVAGDTRHYITTISPLRGSRGEITGVVGINRDCTEQVKRDKSLSEAQNQLRQAQRLDALGQLAGGVAHDFNNLLTVIMTYAAILQEDAAPGSSESDSIKEITAASERAAALTRQLLAFSRRQVLQPRAIDLNETVGEVEKMLRRLIASDIELEFVLDKKLGLVMADSGQIEQVLINLAINARDAMPDGGRLTISTTNVDLDGSYLDADARALTGPYVMINVSDTGVGMSSEVVSKVFDPFFTTKEVGKGTGLGLATVHGIIEQSGGRVWVYSEVGRGSTFKIYLPRIVEAVVPATAPLQPAQDLGGSETVLLIDDNDELRRVVRRMLQRAGYNVLEAANGAAALAQMDRGVKVDLVVSDVMMPGLGGRAIVDAVRQRHQAVKLLLMSGYNYDTALRGMAQRGDVAFIEKPFTAEKLLIKIREVLGRTSDLGAA